MTTNNSIKSGSSGFSLIELIVTMAIMSIILGIATLNFRSWVVKNNKEAQIREIFVDLNEARTNAFTQKRPYWIVFQPNSYVMKSYTSATAPVPTNATAVTSGTTIKTKNLTYGLTNAGASIVNTPVIFDTTGITFNWFTIFVNPYNTDPSKEPATANCIVISTARINMGKINGTACEFK